MKHQLLHRAGGAVLRRPRLELVVMGQEQLGQIERVLGVVLGAAGDEGLAELLEGDGVDGVERDPFIGFEEGDEMDGGLFQTESHAGLGMLLTQFQQPFPERLRGGVNGYGPALAGGGGDEAQIGLFVGPIQADDQVIGMGRVHGLMGVKPRGGHAPLRGWLFFMLPQA